MPWEGPVGTFTARWGTVGSTVSQEGVRVLTRWSVVKGQRPGHKDTEETRGTPRPQPHRARTLQAPPHSYGGSRARCSRFASDSQPPEQGGQRSTGDSGGGHRKCTVCELREGAGCTGKWSGTRPERKPHWHMGTSGLEWHPCSGEGPAELRAPFPRALEWPWANQPSCLSSCLHREVSEDVLGTLTSVSLSHLLLPSYFHRDVCLSQWAKAPVLVFILIAKTQYPTPTVRGGKVY